MMRSIARQRIDRLFELAEDAHKTHPERSDRYVQIALKISTRMRIRMPVHLKRMVCKGCKRFMPTERRRVRLHNGVRTVTCLSCGRVMRYPYRGG
jgi:ribonuclease P protein subunit RPR2